MFHSYAHADQPVPFVESHQFGEFAIGIFQGFCFTLVGQPWDAVRVNMQTGLMSTVPQKCSTRATAKQLWQKEGYRGFLRGWTLPAFGFAVGRGAQQVTMNTTRDYFIQQQRAEQEKLRQQHLAQVTAEIEARERSLPWWASSVRALGSEKLMEMTGVERKDPAMLMSSHAGDTFASRMQNDTNLETWKNFVCTTLGAVAYTTVYTPSDVVKIRMLTESQFSHRVYHNSLDCAYKLWECGGVRKLYLGYQAALIRDIPAQTITFGLYGMLRPLLPQEENAQLASPWRAVALGAFVGIVQWTTVIPLDCIKTRIQTAPDEMQMKPTWKEAARRIYVLNGWRGFYQGIFAAWGKAACGNAALFAAMEFSCTRVEAYQRRHFDDRIEREERLRQRDPRNPPPPSSAATPSSSSSSSSDEQEF